MLRTDYTKWNNLWEEIENVLPLKKIAENEKKSQIQQTVTDRRRVSQRYWW